MVGDAGVSQGIQRITFSKAGTTGHVTVIVSANTAYIRGDAFILVNYMGFKAVAAAKYAGRWVLIPHTNRGYATVAAGVTLSSTIAELKPAGQLSIVAATDINGQRVVGVRGTKSSSRGLTVDTLFARAAGSPLPVEEVASQGNARLSTTLTRWGEHLQLRAPNGAVPIAKVEATGP